MYCIWSCVCYCPLQNDSNEPWWCKSIYVINKCLISKNKCLQPNLSFEEWRVSAEGSGQYVIIDLVTKVTTEYTEIICNKEKKLLHKHYNSV